MAEQFNGILHLLLVHRILFFLKRIYDKEIRQLIKERKQLKRQLTNSFLKHKKLMKKIKKYDKLIDHKISELNINFIKRSTGKTGTTDKQFLFWKLKKILKIIMSEIETFYSKLYKKTSVKTEEECLQYLFNLSTSVLTEDEKSL